MCSSLAGGFVGSTHLPGYCTLWNGCSKVKLSSRLAGMPSSGSLGLRCWPLLFSSCRRRTIVTTIVFRHGKNCCGGKSKRLYSNTCPCSKNCLIQKLFLSTIVESFTSCTAKIVKIKLFTSHAEKNEIVTSIFTHHPVNRHIVKVQNDIVDIVSI